MDEEENRKLWNCGSCGGCLEIQRTEKKTNQEILVMTYAQGKLKQTIRKRQLEFFGNIMKKMVWKAKLQWEGGMQRRGGRHD